MLTNSEDITRMMMKTRLKVVSRTYKKMRENLTKVNWLKNSNNSFNRCYWCNNSSSKIMQMKLITKIKCFINNKWCNKPNLVELSLKRKRRRRMLPIQGLKVKEKNDLNNINKLMMKTLIQIYFNKC